MIRVKATREGLIGGKTSSGYIVETHVSLVALPSWKALHRHVRVRNPLNGKTAISEVLDVGPHNEHDDAYVFQPATDPTMPDALTPEQRPAAERGEHVVYVNGKPEQRIEPGKVNGAGIDLGEHVWKALEMQGNTDVEWEFIEA